MSGARKRLQIGHVAIDPLTFEGALLAIDDLVSAGKGGAVFTPNVDHVCLAEDDLRYRAAYAKASLCLADGVPIVLTSKLTDTPLPAKVSGSDLVGPLMRLAAERGRRVYLFGAAEGIADRAALMLKADFPELVICGTASPKVDLDEPKETRERTLAAIRAAKPDLVLVALGAPKQEIWIAEVMGDLAPAVLLGIGATLDFVAGAAKRAPSWISAIGMEWAYRLVHEPRRLWRRYLVRDRKYPLIVYRQFVSERSKARHS